MNNKTHQYVNVYRNQLIIAFVLKFVFVHFRQKNLEITKHYKTNFNIYIYIYIYKHKKSSIILIYIYIYIYIYENLTHYSFKSYSYYHQRFSTHSKPNHHCNNRVKLEFIRVNMFKFLT